MLGGFMQNVGAQLGNIGQAIGDNRDMLARYIGAGAMSGNYMENLTALEEQARRAAMEQRLEQRALEELKLRREAQKMEFDYQREQIRRQREQDAQRQQEIDAPGEILGALMAPQDGEQPTGMQGLAQSKNPYVQRYALDQLTQEPAEDPDWLQKLKLARQIQQVDPEGPLSAWAAKELEQAPGDQSQWEWMRDTYRRLQAGEPVSPGDREFLEYLIGKGGTDLEVGPDGIVRFRTGGSGGLTIGSLGRTQEDVRKMGEVRLAIDGLEQKLQSAPSWAFGATGERVENVAGIAKQFEDLVPGLGQAAEFIYNDAAESMRQTAKVIEARLLPILTGDTSRYTDQDVGRARDALAILRSGGNRDRAITSLREVNRLLQKIEGYNYDVQNAGGLPPPASWLNDPSVPEEAKIKALEEFYRAQGIDPNTVGAP